MKIFDCFMYFDEDILLELRLNYLDKFVDKFIIVESNYKYLKPITYDQKIKVICYLDEYKYRLKISYKIKDFYSNKVFTTGHTIQVPVDLNGKYSKIHQNELIDIITKIKKNEIKRKTKLRKK